MLLEYLVSLRFSKEYIECAFYYHHLVYDIFWSKIYYFLILCENLLSLRLCGYKFFRLNHYFAGTAGRKVAEWLLSLSSPFDKSCENAVKIISPGCCVDCTIT